MIAGGLDQAVDAAGPEFGGHVGLTQPIGHEMKHWVSSLGPEFLGPLDSAVDLLDG